jgi:ribosomal protein L11 methyltransferase
VSAPDRWLVIDTWVPEPEARPLVAAELAEFSGGAVEERGEFGERLRIYMSPPEYVEATVESLEEQLRDVLGERAEFLVTWDWLENQDWAAEWKRGLAPRVISPRLVVKPTWTEWQAAPGQIVIDVDPQMAFGTGEHATTRGCLRLLDAIAQPGERVVDVGSGSAILAIAAARLGAAEAIAVEYDPDANLNARENLEQNGVQDRVRIIEAMADPVLLAELGQFDVILANILSGVIRPLLPAFRAALRPGGRLIVSGILRTEHEAVVADAVAAGFRVDQVDEEEEWWSALLRAAV